MTHQHDYLVTPRSGAYDMNVGKVNGNNLAEEQVDNRIMTDSGEKTLKQGWSIFLGKPDTLYPLFSF